MSSCTLAMLNEAAPSSKRRAAMEARPMNIARKRADSPEQFWASSRRRCGRRSKK